MEIHDAVNQEHKHRILVVDDEAHIAEGLKLNLELQGYTVSLAQNGLAALNRWQEWKPDLIVLDIMLPGMDGLSVLQHIRLEDEKIPILILSAKSALDDKVKGLTYGVDDYLTKPFSLEEFLLRVDRLLTRLAWYREDIPIKDSGADDEGRYFFGPNRIDFITMQAQCRQGTITITAQEARLLKIFFNHARQPLSRKKLLEIGWGYSGKTTTRTVDNFIVRFRKYFEKDPKNPVHFKSLRSVGYIFNPSAESQ